VKHLKDFLAAIIAIPLIILIVAAVIFLVAAYFIFIPIIACISLLCDSVGILVYKNKF
jgi:hypothetical protein